MCQQSMIHMSAHLLPGYILLSGVNNLAYYWLIIGGIMFNAGKHGLKWLSQMFR